MNKDVFYKGSNFELKLSGLKFPIAHQLRAKMK